MTPCFPEGAPTTLQETNSKGISWQDEAYFQLCSTWKRMDEIYLCFLFHSRNVAADSLRGGGGAAVWRGPNVGGTPEMKRFMEGLLRTKPSLWRRRSIPHHVSEHIGLISHELSRKQVYLMYNNRDTVIQHKHFVFSWVYWTKHKKYQKKSVPGTKVSEPEIHVQEFIQAGCKTTWNSLTAMTQDVSVFLF